MWIKYQIHCSDWFRKFRQGSTRNLISFGSHLDNKGVTIHSMTPNPSYMLVNRPPYIDYFKVPRITGCALSLIQQVNNMPSYSYAPNLSVPCMQSTFHSVKGHNRRLKSRSGDGSRHLGMWWTIILHISWFTVNSCKHAMVTHWPVRHALQQCCG